MDMMREISLQTDPEAMVSTFRRRSRDLFGDSGSMSLSQRGFEEPWYRVTRSTMWKEQPNPWKHPERLPIHRGGLLSELLYADEARIIRDLSVHEDDPAYEYLRDAKSLLAVPLFDEGHALNMVVRFSERKDTYDGLDLPDWVLRANLFGRATKSLVLKDELAQTYSELDRELQRVGQIQRSLLPTELPTMPGFDIAASYDTAARAGGDYYDFFPFSDGRWGMLIADVSGHGTPAAVLMAILRTMLHTHIRDLSCPAEVLQYANRTLCAQMEHHPQMFVTAFFGILNPADGGLSYSCAGHNPPLLVNRSIEVLELDKAQSLPLGILQDAEYTHAKGVLAPGDTLLLYTDGITEASNARGEMYGRTRLLSCVREDVPNAQHIIDCVTMKLLGFTGESSLDDDRTLVAIRRGLSDERR
jgi:sigma-B regulation protein RsbU (phosphoserine phosphatase)